MTEPSRTRKRDMVRNFFRGLMMSTGGNKEKFIANSTRGPGESSGLNDETNLDEKDFPKLSEVTQSPTPDISSVRVRNASNKNGLHSIHRRTNNGKIYDMPVVGDPSSVQTKTDKLIKSTSDTMKYSPVIGVVTLVVDEGINLHVGRHVIKRGRRPVYFVARIVPQGDINYGKTRAETSSYVYKSPVIEGDKCGPNSKSISETNVMAGTSNFVKRNRIEFTGRRHKWNTTIELPVTDIASDVHVNIYEKRKITGDICIGRVIIPLYWMHEWHWPSPLSILGAGVGLTLLKSKRTTTQNYVANNARVAENPSEIIVKTDTKSKQRTGLRRRNASGLPAYRKRSTRMYTDYTDTSNFLRELTWRWFCVFPHPVSRHNKVDEVQDDDVPTDVEEMAEIAFISKHHPAVPRERRIGFGLDRPDKPLGCLRLGFSLHLNEPIENCYLLSNKLSNIRKIDRCNDETEQTIEKSSTSVKEATVDDTDTTTNTQTDNISEESISEKMTKEINRFSKSALKRNVYRLKALKQSPRLIVKIVETLSWKRPFHSAIAMIIVGLMFYFVKIWQMPLVFMIGVTAASTGVKHRTVHLPTGVCCAGVRTRTKKLSRQHTITTTVAAYQGAIGDFKFVDETVDQISQQTERDDNDKNNNVMNDIDDVNTIATSGENNNFDIKQTIETASSQETLQNKTSIETNENVRSSSIVNEPNIAMWRDEVEQPEINILKKFQRYKIILGGIQKYTGKLATVLERLKNIFSWTDPQVTATALVILGIFTSICSLILWLFSIRTIGFVCYVFLNVFLYRRRKKKEKMNSVNKRPKKHPIHPNVEKKKHNCCYNCLLRCSFPSQLLFRIGVRIKTYIVHLLLSIFSNVGRNIIVAIRHLRISMYAFWERIPDGLEDAHRGICYKAVIGVHITHPDSDRQLATDWLEAVTPPSSPKLAHRGGVHM